MNLKTHIIKWPVKSLRDRQPICSQNHLASKAEIQLEKIIKNEKIINTYKARFIIIICFIIGLTSEKSSADIMLGVNFEQNFIKKIYNQSMISRCIFFNLGTIRGDKKHLSGIEFSPFILSYIKCYNDNYWVDDGGLAPYIFAYYYYRISDNLKYSAFYLGAKAGYSGNTFNISYNDGDETIQELDGLQHTERTYGGPVLKGLFGFKYLQLNIATGLLICSRTTENIDIDQHSSIKKGTHVYPSFHTEMGANFTIGKHTIPERKQLDWKENGKGVVSYDLLILPLSNFNAFSSSIDLGIKYKKNYLAFNAIIPHLLKRRLGGVGLTYKYEHIINEIFLIAPGLNVYVVQYNRLNSHEGDVTSLFYTGDGYFLGPLVEIGIGKNDIFLKAKAILLCGPQDVKLAPAAGISLYF